jgi:hypothetical protein
LRAKGAQTDLSIGKINRTLKSGRGKKKITPAEHLFNIIIEFPDFQPALKDLRDCLVHTDLPIHLISSLKQVLDAKKAV